MTQTSTPYPMRAYIVLVMGIAAISLAAIFIRLAQQEAMPSMLIAGGRLILATLLLTPATLLNKSYRGQIGQLNRQSLILVGVSGFFLAMHFASWVSSLEHTTVLISVVLVSTTPIWVALLEVFFLKARLSQMVVVGLVVALVGGIVLLVMGSKKS